MTDKELLELAAKAAGIEYNPNYGKGFWVGEFYSGKEWNPLTDDGDALRLAVKVGVLISPNEDGKTIVALPTDDILVSNQIIERHGNDPHAATRRAIVRASAAAEIGKGVK